MPKGDLETEKVIGQKSYKREYKYERNCACKFVRFYITPPRYIDMLVDTLQSSTRRL
jgi:hypothetical protein